MERLVSNTSWFLQVAHYKQYLCIYMPTFVLVHITNDATNSPFLPHDVSLCSRPLWGNALHCKGGMEWKDLCLRVKWCERDRWMQNTFIAPFLSSSPPWFLSTSASMSSLSYGGGELPVLFPFVSAEKPVRAVCEYRFLSIWFVAHWLLHLRCLQCVNTCTHAHTIDRGGP